MPCTEDSQPEKEEAEAKFANLQRKKFTSDQSTQLFTDEIDFASNTQFNVEKHFCIIHR